MGFWRNINTLDLQDFRPGIRSKAEIGEKLVIALMEIGPEKEDPGHLHPFEQCGIVTEGKIEMFIGDERSVLEPMDAYLIPSEIFHGWKTFDTPVKILDISIKPD